MDNNIKRTEIKPGKLLSKSWKYGSFIYIFAVMFLIYIIMNARYLNWKSITNLFVHTFPVGIVALGMGLIIISGEIDLSVGAMWAFTGGMGIIINNAVYQSTGDGSLSMFVGFISIIGIGALLGFINGFMVGKMKIPAFIATLGSMLILRSMCQYALTLVPTETGSQQQIYEIMDWARTPWHDLNTLKIASIPITALVFIAICLIIYYVAKHTKFGRRIYAVGSNAKASSLAGINVPWTKVAIFSLAGALVGLSAFLYVGVNKSLESTSAGLSYELYAIASCVIGGIAMTGGRGNVIGILFGSLSYAIIDKIISVANLDPLINDTIKGIILLTAVILQIGLLDKDSFKKLLRDKGIIYNPKQNEYLESVLRKKINDVKLAYDKKFNKILDNKNISKEDGERQINALLDEREAKIEELNNIYNLKIDNATLKASEYARKQEIKEARHTLTTALKDAKYVLKIKLRDLVKHTKPQVRPICEYEIETIKTIYDTYLANLEKINVLENNVELLKDNAKHVLDRDLTIDTLKANAQANYDKRIAEIEAGVVTCNAKYEQEKTNAAKLYNAKIEALEKTIADNKDNEAALIEANKVVLEKLNAQEEKRAQRHAAIQARKDAKKEKIKAEEQAAAERKAYLESIFDQRGQH